MELYLEDIEQITSDARFRENLLKNFNFEIDFKNWCIVNDAKIKNRLYDDVFSLYVSEKVPEILLRKFEDINKEYKKNIAFQRNKNTRLKKRIFEFEDKWFSRMKKTKDLVTILTELQND